MAVSVQTKKEFQRFLASSLFLPAFATLGIWWMLNLAELKDSFSASFCSGDLFSLAAMLFIILVQEIEKVSEPNRGGFLIFFQEHAVAASAIMWVLFGGCKILAMIVFPNFPDKGADALLKVSWSSIIVFLAVAVFTVSARYDVMTKQ